MNLDMRGKVALVTGGSRGIGRACAENLAAEGCDVMIVARTEADLDEAAAAIGKAGGRRVEICATDLRSPQGCEAAVGALRKGGRVVLVGLHPHPASISPLELIVGEKELIGSFSHVYDVDFAEALRLLGSRQVRAAPVISDRVPLDRALADGLLALDRDPRGHVKILVGGGPGA